MHTYPLFLLEPYTWCESSIMHHRRTSNIIIIIFFRLLLYAVLFVLASAPSRRTITLSASSIS